MSKGCVLRSRRISNTCEWLGPAHKQGPRRGHSGYEVEWNTEPDFVEERREVELTTGFCEPEEPELTIVDEPEEDLLATHWGIPEGAGVEVL